MKIPDIQYSDASESTRRTKCVAWRAAVESSTNLEQLALQVMVLIYCSLGVTSRSAFLILAFSLSWFDHSGSW